MFLMLSATYLWDLYGSSIAFPIRSLDHSLSTRLIPAGAWVHGVLAFLHTFKISMGALSRSLSTHLIARYPLV